MCMEKNRLLKGQRQDWEILRDRCRPILLFGELDVFVYADALFEKGKISYIDALEIASERIDELSKYIEETHNISNIARADGMEREYYTRLLKMIREAT